MKLEEAKKILNKFDNRCKGCIDEEFCEGCYIDNEDVKAIETLLQHVKHLQKENEELKKRFKKYGDVDLVKLAQIKEIEETVPKFCIDKETYENLLKEV